MKINGAQPKEMSSKGQSVNGSDTIYVLGSSARDGLAGGLAGAAFGYFTKVDKDEFVKIGADSTTVLKNLQNIPTIATPADAEEELNRIFNKGKGEQFEKTLQAVKKAKALKVAKIGLIFCGIAGALFSLAQVYSEKRAAKK